MVAFHLFSEGLRLTVGVATMKARFERSPSLRIKPSINGVAKVETSQDRQIVRLGIGMSINVLVKMIQHAEVRCHGYQK